MLGSSGKGSGLGVRRTALLLISSVKSLYLSESDERIELGGLECISHLQYLELSGQWERQPDQQPGKWSQDLYALVL